MQELLFLAHRIPYPPNKGDKIRSYHILEHLACRFRVHLGSFVDDPADWQYVDTVKALCAETCFLPLSPTGARWRSLTGLLSGKALSLPYYFQVPMQRWVDRILRERPVAGAFAFSSVMAQYLTDHPGLRLVTDMVDVDSEKWRQYAQRKPWPASWIYRREADRLLDYEHRIERQSERTLFVSAQEAELFRRLLPSADKVGVVENGVDAAYFDAGDDHPNPFPPQTDALVFTGAMDYWPNVDAVTWLADEVLPQLIRVRPNARFYIVGARPSRQVLALAQRAAVVVTGTVPDVRPYLAHARVVVAPLRIARGVQNKLLEAMAMDKPIIATHEALTGIAVDGALAVNVADTAADWIARLDDMLGGGEESVGNNRRFVRTRYRWDDTLRPLDRLWS